MIHQIGCSKGRTKKRKTNEGGVVVRVAKSCGDISFESIEHEAKTRRKNLTWICLTRYS